MILRDKIPKMENASRKHYVSTSCITCDDTGRYPDKRWFPRKAVHDT